jgi:hypothetical protein
MGDGAKPARPGAGAAHQQKSGRAMLKAMRPVGAAGLLADGVEAALPQTLLYAVQVGELYPLLRDPLREAQMAVHANTRLHSNGFIAIPPVSFAASFIKCTIYNLQCTIVDAPAAQ